MTENRIRHLPVIDGGLLIGMVSIGDLVRNLIVEQQFTIHQLVCDISMSHVGNPLKHRAVRVYQRDATVPS